MLREERTTAANQNDILAKQKLDSLRQYFIGQLQDFFKQEIRFSNKESAEEKYNNLYLRRGKDTKLWDNIVARLSSCMTLNSLKKYGKEFSQYNPENAEESTVLTECIRRVLSIVLKELKSIERESDEIQAIEIPFQPSHNMFLGLKYTSNHDTSYDNLPSALALATFKV